MRMFGLWLTLLALPHAPAWAESFDLVCNGDRVSDGSRTPDSRRVYSVNLEEEEYCAHPCTTVLQITEITPSRLVFERTRIRSGNNALNHNEWVDRVTGEVWREVIPATVQEYDMFHGVCERAEFSGFPERKF